jgi:hypothetical protein
MMLSKEVELFWDYFVAGTQNKEHYDQNKDDL